MLNLTKEDWTIYAPEFAGNREDPDPMTVEVHALSAGEARTYARKAVSKMKGKDDGSLSKVAEASEKAAREIFLANVRNIRGFSINGAPVEDVATFFEEAPIQLVQEIAQAIEDESHLGRGRRDRSASPSGG